MNDRTVIYAELHNALKRSTAKLLQYDVDNLTPQQTLRLDLACSLRLEIDRNASLQARGEAADLKSLITASQALESLLRPDAVGAVRSRGVMPSVFRIFLLSFPHANSSWTPSGKGRHSNGPFGT